MASGPITVQQSLTPSTRGARRTIPSPAVRALKYLWAWNTNKAVPRERVRIDPGPGAAHGVLYGRMAPDNAAPAWVLLHGVTSVGEDHPSLVRFAQALTRSGGSVLVPEVPSWKQLDLDPTPARQAIRHAVQYVAERGNGPPPPKAALIGFSFGSPQAILAGASRDLKDLVSVVVGFGGYGNLEATVRFGLTGEFTDQSEACSLRPDPYGRWVVASNFLHRISGLEAAADVSAALRRLAQMAGERRIMSWDPAYDSVKVDLAREVAAERQGLFRLFAPPAGQEPDRALAVEMAPLIAQAARKTFPTLDPRGHYDQTPPPVRLVHGRRDHLIPHTESRSLAGTLPEDTDVRVLITELFAHSEEDGTGRIPSGLFAFYRALREIMSLQAGGSPGAGPPV